MTLPNFMIAGAARCGTTSLYYYLKQHPEIGFPDKKEPKFFSYSAQKFPHNGPGDHTVDQGMIHDFEEYKALFQGLEKFKCIGEASSDYLYFHETTAQEIYNTVGDIPIILCLRDPVERAYSAYNNLLRDQRETLDFVDALEAENDRLSKNWDWMWAYQAGSLYAKQVATYQQVFSKVKVVLFEDLTENSDAVVQDVFSFLGVDDQIKVNTSTRYSHSGKAKNKVVAFLSNRDNPLAFMLRKLALKIVPRSMLEKVASKSLKQEGMPKEVRIKLEAYFKEDIHELEKVIGKSLEVWK